VHVSEATLDKLNGELTYGVMDVRSALLQLKWRTAALCWRNERTSAVAAVGLVAARRPLRMLEV